MPLWSHLHHVASASPSISLYLFSVWCTCLWESDIYLPTSASHSEAFQTLCSRHTKYWSDEMWQTRSQSCKTLMFHCVLEHCVHWFHFSCFLELLTLKGTWEKFFMTAYLQQKASQSWCILQYFFLYHTEAGLLQLSSLKLTFNSQASLFKFMLCCNTIFSHDDHIWLISN